MAERMFGSTTPTAQVDHGAELREALGNRGTMPPAPDRSQVTDEDRAQTLFGGTDPVRLHGDAAREIERMMMENLADPDEAAAAAADWVAEFQELGLTSTESATITGIAASVVNNPPSAQMVTSWVEESRAALVQDYGREGAAQALADAREFIGRFGTPELRDVLNMTGLGNHPDVVRVAAQKARALRLAGRF
jgi:predicted short-subunit dehydrogenase-like oxidoreductase (DUF2520 family)